MPTQNRTRWAKAAIAAAALAGLCLAWAPNGAEAGHRSSYGFGISIGIGSPGYCEPAPRCYSPPVRC